MDNRFNFTPKEIVECSILIFGILLLIVSIIRKYRKKNLAKFSSWSLLFRLQFLSFVATLISTIGHLMYVLNEVYVKSIKGLEVKNTVLYVVSRDLSLFTFTVAMFLDITANLFRYQRIVVAANEDKTRRTLKIIGITLFVLLVIVNILFFTRVLANFLNMHGIIIDIFNVSYVTTFATTTLAGIIIDVYTSVRMAHRVLSTVLQRTSKRQLETSSAISEDPKSHASFSTSEPSTTPTGRPTRIDSELDPIKSSESMARPVNTPYKQFKRKLYTLVLTIIVLDIMALAGYITQISDALPPLIFVFHILASFEFLSFLKSESSGVDRRTRRKF